MPIPRTSPECEGSPDLRYDECGRFCGGLDDGLHAMAQPLTILRSALAMLTLPQTSEARQRYYLETACAQVERACRLFEGVRSLVAVRLGEAEQSSFEIWDLLAPMIEVQSELLRESMIEIRLSNPGFRTTVVGDAERTEQALSAILSAAAAVASRGDVIELDASQHGMFLRIDVRNSGSKDTRLDASNRLGLSLAEANVLIQQGHYEFSEDPFCVSLALPLNQVDARALAGAGSLQESQIHRNSQFTLAQC